jgi:hypothetical protein
LYNPKFEIRKMQKQLTKQIHGGQEGFGLDIVLFVWAQRERMSINMLGICSSWTLLERFTEEQPGELFGAED